MRTLILITALAIPFAANAQQPMTPRQAQQEFVSTSMIDISCAVYYEKLETPNLEYSTNLKNVVISHGKEHQYPADEVKAFLDNTYKSILLVWEERVVAVPAQLARIKEVCEDARTVKRASGPIDNGNMLPQ